MLQVLELQKSQVINRIVFNRIYHEMFVDLIISLQVLELQKSQVINRIYHEMFVDLISHEIFVVEYMHEYKIYHAKLFTLCLGFGRRCNVAGRKLCNGVC